MTATRRFYDNRTIAATTRRRGVMPLTGLCGLAVGGMAILLACYSADDYVLSPALVDRTLAFAPEDTVDGSPVTTLPADGFSRLTLVASIDSLADGNRRTLVFTTSAGTLLGGTGTPTSQQVTANGQGHASIDLVSTTTVQAVRVRAELKDVTGMAKELTIQFTAVTPDDIIRFVDVPDTLPADQASLGTIAVVVSARLAGAQRAVTFTTSAGSFPQATTVTPLTDNVARIDLKSGSAAVTARIQASVAGFARETLVVFAPALPDTVVLDPGAFSIKANAVATVHAKLSRSKGTVTPGTFVVFEAHSAGGASVGQFRPLVQPSDPTGGASVEFAPTGVTPPATITLEARALGSDKLGRTTLEVTAP